MKTFHITSGSLEALKWLGMLAMTIDHANRIFFQGDLHWAYDVGRIAWPLFAFVFAWNYAHISADSEAFYKKSFIRLLLFGVLATPAYILMNGLHSLYPLNILFTLFVIGVCIFFYEDNGNLTVEPLAVFLVGGFLVEYNWPGLLLGISFWFVCKKQSLLSALSVLLAFFLLYFVNFNLWALAALPFILLALQVNIPIPRWRYFFWCYYPLHMAILLLLHRIKFNNI